LFYEALIFNIYHGNNVLLCNVLLFMLQSDTRHAQLENNTITNKQNYHLMSLA